MSGYEADEQLVGKLLRTHPVGDEVSPPMDKASSIKNVVKLQNNYVFCLNTGETRESSYPLDLNNWEFYIVPTSFINDKCGNNKTISLGRIKSFGFIPKKYNELRKEIDFIIDSAVDNI